MNAARIRTSFGLSLILGLLGGSASFAASIPLPTNGVWLFYENGSGADPADVGDFFTGGPLTAKADPVLLEDDPNLTDWFFTAINQVRFDITDIGNASDSYALYEFNGVDYDLFSVVANGTQWESISDPTDQNCFDATTPNPLEPVPNAACHQTGASQADINGAFADPAFSKDTFFFGPGTHRLRIQIIDIPDQTDHLGLQQTATVAFRATEIAAVPEPSTLVLLGTGLIAGAAQLRRRKNRAS